MFKMRLSGRTLPVGLLSAALAIGCAATPPNAAPISPGDFDLLLEADWNAVSHGSTLEVHHTLTNNGATAVCVGGFHEFRFGEQPVQTRVLHDALCKIPLVVVPSHQSRRWVEKVEFGPCTPAVQNSFTPPPSMRCGAELPVQVEIALFRWVGERPAWGAIRIVSRPILARRAVPAERPPNSPDLPPNPSLQRTPPG